MIESLETDYCNSDQARKILKCSHAKLFALREKNMIPFFRIGKCTHLYPIAGLLDFVAIQAIEAALNKKAGQPQ